jgi:hypothetical protein
MGEYILYPYGGKPRHAGWYAQDQLKAAPREVSLRTACIHNRTILQSGLITRCGISLKLKLGRPPPKLMALPERNSYEL